MIALYGTSKTLLSGMHVRLKKYRSLLLIFWNVFDWWLFQIIAPHCSNKSYPEMCKKYFDPKTALNQVMWLH